MERKRLILILGAAVLVGFLLGFFPQWARANRNGERLADARHELRLSRIEDRIGAALTESLRSNYERSRQLMTTVFQEIQASRASVTPAQRRELDAILGQRDEIITLLARAAPESSQRLMLIYSRFHTAFAPGAERAPPVTPSS